MQRCTMSQKRAYGEETKWRPLEGYKIPYRVCEDGYIQGFWNGAWRDIKTQLGRQSTRAYVRLTTESGERKNIPMVHIMADLFLGGRKPGLCLYHLNGDKRDNSVYNLRWISQSKIARKGTQQLMRPVEKIDTNGNVLGWYRSMTIAAKENYVSLNFVSSRCRNKRKNPFSMTGYSFRYEKY